MATSSAQNLSRNLPGEDFQLLEQDPLKVTLGEKSLLPNISDVLSRIPLCCVQWI